jgi:CHAT domain-containing protein
LHLCGAAQVAGYRQVVGSLWPIGDVTAVAVASQFYERLCADGSFDPRLAAAATYDRVPLAGMRPPSAWAAYFHAGL